jgi:hypothetical protein
LKETGKVTGNLADERLSASTLEQTIKVNLHPG